MFFDFDHTTFSFDLYNNPLCTIVPICSKVRGGSNRPLCPNHLLNGATAGWLRDGMLYDKYKYT